MFNYRIIRLFIILFFTNNLPAQTDSISYEALLEDYEILTDAIYSIHPGLYKYQNEVAVEQNFLALKWAIQEGLSLQDAYLAFSTCIAKVMCGHTHVNPYNQSDQIKEAFYLTSDKLPFTLEIINDRIFIQANLSNRDRIKKGMEILSVNGVNAATIITKLLTIVSADGHNNGQRINILQLTGLGKYEVFDNYFPVFFPPSKGQYEIRIFDHSNQTSFSETINTISRADRFAAMEKKYANLPKNYDDLWSFELLTEKAAYLKMGTFVTYKMELNWKKFIDDSFKKIAENNIEHLIIDIRGNGGGMDEVSAYIGKYLVEEPIFVSPGNFKIKYDQVPERLREYLSTWDQSFYSYKGKVEATEDGFFVFKKKAGNGLKIKPAAQPFKGKKWLLVDAANSSATFYMAQTMKKYQMATLVGEQTGGNLKGINGGGMFFLNLPNTKIEVDIPIYGNYPEGEQPDGGVVPDVQIERTITNLIEDTDPVLAYVLEQIEEE